jgi:hypothetical protein
MRLDKARQVVGWAYSRPLNSNIPNKKIMDFRSMAVLLLKCEIDNIRNEVLLSHSATFSHGVLSLRETI